MIEFDPPLSALPDQDHDHDVLLIAGSRPEVARLAPVATAFGDADRIRALTVATGPDPMTVHEAFEALGVPADVTQLLREPPDPQPAASAARARPRSRPCTPPSDPAGYRPTPARYVREPGRRRQSRSEPVRRVTCPGATRQTPG